LGVYLKIKLANENQIMSNEFPSRRGLYTENPPREAEHFKNHKLLVKLFPKASSTLKPPEWNSPHNPVFS
jgi:hypothetical protein